MWRHHVTKIGTTPLCEVILVLVFMGFFFTVQVADNTYLTITLLDINVWG